MSVGRRAVLGLGLGTAAAALTGCNRFGVGGGSADAGSTINMIWWGDANRAKLTEAMLDLYREAHPGVTIKTEYQDSGPYQDKMATRFAAGDVPDLCNQRGDGISEYVDRGALLDLNQHLDVIKLDDVPPELPLARFGDRLFGIPAGLNASGFVINTALTERYEVEIPDGNTWSWDDLWSFSQSITKAAKDRDDKELYGINLPFSETDALAIFLRQRGEDLYTTDGGFGGSEESLVEWWAMSVEQREKGGLPPAGFIESAGGGSAQSPLAAGLVAAQMIPTNNLKAYNDSVDGDLQLNRFPGETQAVRRGMQIGVAMYWSIGAKAPNQAGALDLLNFMINDVEANLAVGPTRGVPISTAVVDGIFDALGPDDQRSVEYIRDLTKEDLVETRPAPAGTTAVTDAVESIDAEVMFGRVAPREAAKQLVRAATDALKK
ncbi:ABC transporter substrate-binding protein [Microlunatus parietis]|uniref:Multiple sugar transport system substrate-binding protein n=1 Tax=Microlunatus parietis TaxID=682979 RepID=A0A7Y9I2N0_9ACTN|nr:extracellular solute-binding protein [Microlunatus parietis]NYE69114.1 multiple sugar transport system substrate-binding protein [Microlunatus parietis]